MTIEELNQSLEKANEIILEWNKSNKDPEYIAEAIYTALEENRKAIIKYLKEK